MVWSEEEIAAFKERRRAQEGISSVGKVDDFVTAQPYSPPGRSPTNSVTRKWKPTPTTETQRSDEWLGSPPNQAKRSWKVKSVSKPVVPDL